MSSEKREQAEGIFSAALDQEPEERTDFVRRHCGEDVELRREVESLLGWAIESSLIERRHVEMLVREAAGEQAELESGKAIGHYMVLEKIGEGGMGEVYLARDARLNRRVALKLLPASSILNQDRLRRFEQEAYAASSLNHR
jgi:serine/threonine-protein kinase